MVGWLEPDNNTALFRVNLDNTEYLIAGTISPRKSPLSRRKCPFGRVRTEWPTGRSMGRPNGSSSPRMTPPATRILLGPFSANICRAPATSPWATSSSAPFRFSSTKNFAVWESEFYKIRMVWKQICRVCGFGKRSCLNYCGDGASFTLNMFHG